MVGKNGARTSSMSIPILVAFIVFMSGNLSKPLSSEPHSRAWNDGTGFQVLCEHVSEKRMGYPCPSSCSWQVASYEARDPFIVGTKNLK